MPDQNEIPKICVKNFSKISVPFDFVPEFLGIFSQADRAHYSLRSCFAVSKGFAF